MDHSGQQRPGRQRGFLSEMREAVRRGPAGRVQAAPPAGRAERLGLAPPEPAGSQAEALPSRIVHAGHRHRIGSELAGSWPDRPAVVFDLDLATDYGGRGEDTGGAVTGRFHVAAIAVHGTFAWWAMTRPDIREHLPQTGRGARLPGTGRLERVLILADPGGLPPVAPPVITWAGCEAAGRRIGRHPVSALEVAGQWTGAAVPVAGLEQRASTRPWTARHRRRPGPC